VIAHLRISHSILIYTALLILGFTLSHSFALSLFIQIIKNPISRHLPPNCHAYAFEPSGELYSPRAFAASLPDDGKPILLVLGATAAENVAVADHPYVQKLVSISEYPLSGACALNRVCGAIENQWGVV